MEYDFSINERVRRARLLKNLTQEEVAEIMGIKVSTYSQKERAGYINATELALIAKVLDADIFYLLYGKEREALLPRPKITIVEPDRKQIYDEIKRDLDTEYTFRYGFLEGCGLAELTKLKLICNLKKRERDEVYKFAHKIYKKEIII